MGFFLTHVFVASSYSYHYTAALCAEAVRRERWWLAFAESAFQPGAAAVLALPEDSLCFSKLCEFAPLYLKCPVCLDIFETPRTLKTCLHTFCANCLGTSKCVICAAPFTDSDVGSNPIITALSSSLRPEKIDAVVALQSLATSTETSTETVKPAEKAQNRSGKWRCRKCGKKKPLRQMRCGVGCA